MARERLNQLKDPRFNDVEHAAFWRVLDQGQGLGHEVHACTRALRNASNSWCREIRPEDWIDCIGFCPSVMKMTEETVLVVDKGPHRKSKCNSKVL